MTYFCLGVLVGLALAFLWIISFAAQRLYPPEYEYEPDEDDDYTTPEDLRTRTFPYNGDCDETFN